MPLVSTPAVVLRTYRYSETSKIVRLATRDYGVQSAIAKGVLRPRSPFGAALETLSEGVAQLYHKETRELQTLAAFDVIQLRRDLAGDLGRFAGAAALSEVMLKMAPPAPLPAAYEAFTLALDALVRATPPQAYRDLVALNSEGADLPMLDVAHAAAHRRLIARFIRHHLDETVRNGGAPKSSAIDIWERHGWIPAVSS